MRWFLKNYYYSFVQWQLQMYYNNTSTFHFCFEWSKVVAHVSTFSYVQTYQESCHNNYFECDYWKLPIKYDLKEKRTSFDSIKLVKVSKGTQYSAESAAPTLVSTCTCRASPAMLSMWPSIKTYFSHSSFSHLLFVFQPHP